MPIRPENRARYPADWPVISRRIRFDRAAGRCECVGECGRPRDHLAADDRCRNRHGQPAFGTGSTVVLTTAHLDHTPEHCGDNNLKAFCPGCHLHYDREHHAETAAATRRRELEASMEPLFDTTEALRAHETRGGGHGAALDKARHTVREQPEDSGTAGRTQAPGRVRVGVLIGLQRRPRYGRVPAVLVPAVSPCHTQGRERPGRDGFVDGNDRRLGDQRLGRIPADQRGICRPKKARAGRRPRAMGQGQGCVSICPEQCSMHASSNARRIARSIAGLHCDCAMRFGKARTYGRTYVDAGHLDLHSYVPHRARPRARNRRQTVSSGALWRRRTRKSTGLSTESST